jgi:hypothetical protein
MVIREKTSNSPMTWTAASRNTNGEYGILWGVGTIEALEFIEFISENQLAAVVTQIFGAGQTDTALLLDEAALELPEFKRSHRTY